MLKQVFMELKDLVFHHYSCQITAIDCMHAVYERVVKKLLHLWFDAEFNECGFSLRRVLTEIDNTLTNIKPPRFIHRKPTSIIKFLNWKASEFKTWFFVLFHSCIVGIHEAGILSSSSFLLIKFFSDF